MGWDVAEAVVRERERNGIYRCLSDFVRRAPVALSRHAIENLVWVGGCDRFGLTRRELLWQVGLWLPPKTEQRDRARVRRQLELPLTHPYETLHFGGLAADERIVAEYQVLGFATSGHPFSLMRDSLPPGVIRSDRLARLDAGTTIEVAGLVVARQRPETARGYTFILLEDEAGMLNAIVRPKVYDRDRVAIRGESFLWITGKLAKDDGTLNIIAEQVRPLALQRHSTGPSHPPPILPRPSPYRFLKQLRRNPPNAKSWG